MLKGILAAAFSSALFVSVGTTTLLSSTGQANAEMATAPKSKAGGSGAERRKKCSAEWKDAKAAGKTGGLKWPKFYSECNKRLKAQGA